jgi:hypothetical protein
MRLSIKTGAGADDWTRWMGRLGRPLRIGDMYWRGNELVIETMQRVKPRGKEAFERPMRITLSPTDRAILLKVLAEEVGETYHEVPPAEDDDTGA